MATVAALATSSDNMRRRAPRTMMAGTKSGVLDLFA
jgi:hypothetical protein